MCDFQEYIYGPKSHWPTVEQMEKYKLEKERMPCSQPVRRRCKCGIYAREGVVPSELGYGWYCGNAVGDYWVMPITCLYVVGRFIVPHSNLCLRLPIFFVVCRRT